MKDESVVRTFGAAIRSGIIQSVRKMKDELPERAQVEVFKHLLAHQPNALWQAVAGPLTATNERALSKALAREHDIASKYLRAAIAAACLTEAAGVLGQLLRAQTLGGIARALDKVQASPAVVSAARQAVEQSKKMRGEFLECCALLGILAKDGSAQCARAIDGFSSRAAASAKGETVHDPNASIGYLLGAVGTGEQVRAIAGRLNAKDAQRRDESPTLALVKRLELPLSGTNWRVSILLNRGAAWPLMGPVEKTGPTISIDIDPRAKYGWHVQAETRRGRYSNRGGDIGQDDLKLPALTSLDALPAWLLLAGKKLKSPFSVQDARISVGRSRSAEPLIRSWLASG